MPPLARVGISIHELFAEAGRPPGAPPVHTIVRKRAASGPSSSITSRSTCVRRLVLVWLGMLTAAHHCRLLDLGAGHVPDLADGAERPQPERDRGPGDARARCAIVGPDLRPLGRQRDGALNVVIACLLVDQRVPIGIAILLTLAAGVIIGLVNAVVVIVWGIDSFIATLATAR